jgi:hypothetical protein
MTLQEQIHNFEQTHSRLDEATDAARLVLATVLANSWVYTPGAAEEHVSKMSRNINGYRQRQADIRDKLKELTK